MMKQKCYSKKYRKFYGILATYSTRKEPIILKTVWRSTYVVVQMDFAEDYKCSDEVQPAY